MAWLSGFGVGGVLLVAWGGSIAGALGVTALLVIADTLLAGRRLWSEPATGSDTLEALIEAWDDDLIQDTADAEATMADASEESDQRAVSGQG